MCVWAGKREELGALPGERWSSVVFQKCQFNQCVSNFFETFGDRDHQWVLEWVAGCRLPLWLAESEKNQS